MKFLRRDEPANKTRVVLCVFPKNPGCTPAGKVIPEDLHGPAASGTTPTVRSSKRARGDLIGAPTQGKREKHSIHTLMRNENIDDIELVRRIDNIGPVEGIVQRTVEEIKNIGPVERIVENIVEEIENIGPVGGIVEDIAEKIGHVVDEILSL
ncbi:hypothetical protein QAD02_003450 [Eretmocerus hayati]|uniref:Uncharacterized protein n=1 Tax=Eretmocerus hayati TaxID=131215 RepID=A0ACC2NNL0_9HYME|nr:hypothetical protein QAD02_003450 [Eretmocerus hayati]